MFTKNSLNYKLLVLFTKITYAIYENSKKGVFYSVNDLSFGVWIDPGSPFSLENFEL